MSAVASTTPVTNKTDKIFQCNPKSIIEHFYYKGWNRRDEKVMKDIIDENLKFRGGLVGSKVVKGGRSGFINYMNTLHNALANNTCEIIELIINADNKKVAARIKVVGIHKGLFFGVDGSGCEVSYAGTAFFTLNDTCDTITEIWSLSDLNSLKNQIGASPDSTFLQI